LAFFSKLLTEKLLGFCADEFAINTDHITTGVSKRISIPRPLWNLALKDSKQFNESAAYFRNYIRGVIEKRRREEAEGKGAKDLMSAMFQAQEDGEAPMTDDEILDETIMFFLAGHETSSNTLCWALYALSQHPNALEKLIEEVDRVLGSRDPEWEDLPKLKYMDAVLKEALRVYNTVPLTGRIALRDIEFKGTRIPKGTQLVLFLQGVHTDPEIFPEPDLFKPERWEGPDASSLPFLAFGYGARMCIGRKFAWTEMQVALARMLQHFTFELVPGQTIERIHSITSGPKHGIRFIFKPRL
jgi:cytochrome P450